MSESVETRLLRIKTLEQLLRIKHMADNRVATVSSQGQAMSGYDELANYRQILQKYEKSLGAMRKEKP